METERKKLCFSKKLLIADYLILLLMVVIFTVMTVTGHDTGDCAVVAAAWIAQLGFSSGAYYWKAKAENLVKMPVQLLEDLSADMKEKADPNQIIAAVVGIGTNQN